VANGAQSTFARQIGGHQLEADHHCAGLRAYYRGVKDLSPHNFIELHFDKALLPGYFWIFPLPNGEANVGLGMLTAAVAKKKVNLRALFQELIAQHPNLKDRFAEAEMIGPVRGFGLPLGSKQRSISGAGYLLLGDAASLIDPVTGEGISHAMLSGRQAASTAMRALAAQDFSAAFLSKYDADIYLHLGKQLQLSHLMQRMLRFPRIIDFVANRAARNPRLSDTVTNMFLDRNLRQQLKQPGFYVRLALGPKRGPMVRMGIRVFRAGMRTLRSLR
jgi:flavin-dependent dehydrogenase